MLKCVASKRRTRLLNKLNKSSAIHPGPGGSPAHVDQRRKAASCNITQWRRGPTGGKQHIEANTEHCLHEEELCTNTAATPVQKLHPLPLQPSQSIIHTGGVERGGQHLETWHPFCGWHYYLGGDRRFGRRYVAYVNILMQFSETRIKPGYLLGRLLWMGAGLKWVYTVVC